jgi:hypothetical protein
MKTWMRVAAGGAVGVMLWAGTAMAQGSPTGCDKGRTPERLAGEVVKLDAEHGKVILRGSDGTTHEMQASKETLQGYKVGDRIEAKLRSTPDCK